VPTIRDLARQLNVSVATVSNALRGTGRVSADVARDVLDLARRTGYVPRHAARALRTGRTATVGLILPNITNPLFPAFAQAIEQAARSRGYAILLADSHDDAAGQADEVQHLVARGADALIVIPRRGSVVGKTPVPTAIVDCNSTPGNAVASDHRAGGVLVAKHLTEFGHRNILVLAGPTNSAVAAARVDGMKEVFGALRAVTVTYLHSDYGLATGQQLTAQADLQRITAIAAVSDTLAVGALQALRARGLRVPDDMTVTGFDDTVWASIVTPPLTSVRQDLKTIAETAVAVALGEHEGGVVVPVSLLTRASSGAPRTSHHSPALLATQG
jgi:LacI family transcriptional regulator